MDNNLIENIDYYFDDLERYVFTEAYHLKRGYCCGNDCKHCPWKDSSANSKVQNNRIDSETSSE